jgi:hypothetical protein
VNPSLALAFVTLLPLVQACGAPAGEPPLLTVKELVPRIDQLNGRTVRVAGYLAECEGYGCDLYSHEQDLAVWNQVYAKVRERKRFDWPDLPVLGIGSGDDFEFDAAAAPFTNSYVVITGRVNNRCRINGKRGCTDRSPDLDPINIVAWRGPVPAPQSPRRRA